MIDNAISFIADQTEQYIGQILPNAFSEKKVVLTTFVNDAGQTQIPSETVGVSLLNIEQERTFRARPMGQLETGSSATPTEIAFVHRPIDLNLQLMFTANFSNYKESLKHIGYVIQCFQANP
ncbi:MAG: DUF4255 domain-containing protein, partial [Psychrosphaera sp.]|nr:DUF4255 domain-containing protein [Psychrosphaera sp.]